MHGMPGSLGDYVPEQWLTDQSQVADQIQRLVPAALVRETQTIPVSDPLAMETDGVVERGSANQPHVTHLVQFVFEAEGSSRRDLLGIAFRRHLHVERLPSDERMIVE